MNVQANNNGGPTGGICKYPNKHGYEADMGRYLYNSEVFSDVSIDTLHRYNQRRASLAKNNFTAACYATMTPREELIEIMKQVDRDAPHLEPNPFRPKDTVLERGGSHYGALVAAHTKQCNRQMNDLALQVSNAVIGASNLPNALTKLIRNIEARVFADMQSAPPQEMDMEYGLPAGGRPDMQTDILSLSSQSVLAILDDQAVIIHGHSVKGIQRVVRCYENANETSRGLDVEETKRIWCQPESAMFCTHLSHFGYAVQLLPKKGFSYKACDEEMPNPLLNLIYSFEDYQ